MLPNRFFPPLFDSEVISQDENNHKLSLERKCSDGACVANSPGDCYLRSRGPRNYALCRPLFAQRVLNTHEVCGSSGTAATIHTMNIQGMLDELEADWKGN